VPNTSNPRTITINTPDGSPSGGNNFFDPVVKLNFLQVNIQCQ